jgi:hypothetical protein
MDTSAATAPRTTIPAVRWIPRTFVGWAAGLFLAIALIIGVDSLGISGTQFPLAVGMGLGVGAVQARLVISLLGSRRPWIAATTAGLSLPFVAGDALRLAGVPPPYALAAYVAIGGVLAAALQGRLLRARSVAGTQWWVAITPIGWILAAAVVWLNDLLPKNVTGLLGAGRYLAVVLSGGVVLGAASAAAWRLMASKPSVRQPATS